MKIKVKPVATFHYIESDPSNGLLQFVYDKKKSTFLNLEGSLEIKASSYEGSSIYQIVSNDTFVSSNYFQTGNKPNSWIQFEFNSLQVSIMSYTYRTRQHDFHEKWYLLGSNDNLTFEIIDERENSGYPSQNENEIETRHYSCNQGNTKAYSYIRLYSDTQRSDYYDGQYRIPLYGFELYGQAFSSFTITFYQRVFLFHRIFILFSVSFLEK